jgi:ATP-binding cassette subfamily B (MDR/TAP) protein 1
MTKANTDAAGASTAAYAQAGGVAKETLGSMRTVASLNAEPKQGETYAGLLVKAEEAGIRKATRVGFANGMLFSAGNIMCAVGFLYANWKISRNVRDSETMRPTWPFTNSSYGSAEPNVTMTQYNCNSAAAQEYYHDISCSISGGDLLTAIFCIQMGAQGLGLIEPCLQTLTKARKAAKQIMQVMDRTPSIDVYAGGDTMPSVTGEIRFEEVRFAYPSNPAHPVMQGYNLTVAAGTTVALVGQSGSGKSTAIQLVERFYDPEAGRVLLDGVNLREINVHHLRTIISLVGQEPVLFAGTVADNIRFGKPGATDAEVENAAHMANAFGFISEFPERFATDVGEKGGKLSGGQKQRVAIARAMISDPTVLLLDEATSALDTESERVVQAALDDLLAKHPRTTMVIAHRLSTIRNSDKIAVVDSGRVLEQGSHEQLLALEGKYHSLVHAQAGAH